MVDPLAKAPDATTPPIPEKRTFKKGSLVRVNKDSYLGSVESKASDPVPPDYIFKGPGEVLLTKGDYAQIRWKLPVPDVWLRQDQLEQWKK